MALSDCPECEGGWVVTETAQTRTWTRCEHCNGTGAIDGRRRTLLAAIGALEARISKLEEKLERLSKCEVCGDPADGPNCMDPACR